MRNLTYQNIIKQIRIEYYIKYNGNIKKQKTESDIIEQK